MLTGGRASAQAKIINDPSVFEPTFASDPQGAIKAARERIAAGDLAGAVKVLQIYVVSHPGEAGPERFLGDLYYRQGRFDKAEEVYKNILDHNPGDRETHNRLGVVYGTQNRVDEAIDQFNKALPGTDSVSDLVEMHARKGDLPAYRKQMEALANAQPTNADIQAEMGQVMAALHKPADALGYFMRALDSDPQSLTALNGLGLAYFDLQNYTEAEKDFRACIAIDTTNYTCTNNIGAAFLQSGDDESSKPFLIRAHSLAPERPEALVNFGFLADRRGDWKRAVDYYVQATVVGPYLPEAVYRSRNRLRAQRSLPARAIGIAQRHRSGARRRAHSLLARRGVRVARTKIARARPTEDCRAIVRPRRRASSERRVDQAYVGKSVPANLAGYRQRLRRATQSISMRAPLRQRGDGDGRARGLRRAEVFVVDGVDGREIVHVDEEDRRFDDVVEPVSRRRRARLRDCRSTRSAWAATSPATSSPVCGSSGIWPLQKSTPLGANRLAVGTDRRGRVRREDALRALRVDRQRSGASSCPCTLIGRLLDAEVRRVERVDAGDFVVGSAAAPPARPRTRAAARGRRCSAARVITRGSASSHCIAACPSVRSGRSRNRSGSIFLMPLISHERGRWRR